MARREKKPVHKVVMTEGKNNDAIPYMVNGFISQFVIHVMKSPLGFFPLV